MPPAGRHAGLRAVISRDPVVFATPEPWIFMQIERPVSSMSHTVHARIDKCQGHPCGQEERRGSPRPLVCMEPMGYEFKVRCRRLRDANPMT